MKSEITYTMGNIPPKGGMYLTIRKSINSDYQYVTFNSYDDVRKMWLMASPDMCDIIAYCNIKDIKIE